MTLAEATGRTYGPATLLVEPSAVAAFVAATGDDPIRWAEHAPPSYAAAALFAVAPSFLDDPVAGGIRSLIHTEQTFRWSRPLEIGEALAVDGRVADVRTRRSLHLVTFEMTAGSWLEGTASFLMSPEAAARSEEEPEPPHDARAAFDPAPPAPLPSEGEDLPPLHRSASRADLVRYAAAGGDWNPIHWDHAAAVAAGLPGVVVHGLLMASWLCQAAGRHIPGVHPLAEMRFRFRKPLRPSAAAVITGAAGTDGELRLALSAGGAPLVSASARVTA
jgi:acyl dehydratase